MLDDRRHDREILRLAVPALGALAAEPLYVLVDTAVVGHLGTAQLGGVAVAGSLLAIGFALFNFLAYGTTALVARALGAGDARAGATRAVQALWVGVGLGVALTALGVGFAAPAARVMGASDAVLGYATTYLRISALGAPAVLVALVGMGYLRGLQDTRTPLVIALAGNVVNLVVELWLIYGLGWGVAGSAWGTVLAQWGAAVAFLAYVRRGVRVAGASLRPGREGLRVTAAVGGHLVVRTGSLLTALTVATAVAARIGPVPLAAHQIAFQLWSFLALVLDAIAIAGQAMIGRLLGAMAPDEARSAARRMIWWGIVAGVAFGLLVAAARPGLVRLFTDDPGVQAEALAVLWLVAAVQPLNAVVFVLDGVLIGAGDVRYLGAGMAVVSFGLFLPAAAAVAASGRGLVALWAALTLFMAGRLVVVLRRFLGSRWLVTGG